MIYSCCLIPNLSRGAKQAEVFRTTPRLQNGNQIMRCLLKHKWVMGETFDVKSFTPWRKCKRCGTIQLGTYDKVRKDIAWETIRERVYNKSKHARIIRQSSSGLDQLAHTLRLRRTRKSDRKVSIRRPARHKA